MTADEILHDCQRFLGAIFDPEDVIEFRPIKPADKRWGKLADLPGLMPWLASSNEQRKHIYFGANPRRASGLSDAAGVLLGRCLFADFDGGALDYWVTGYGTGGTMTGVSRVLRKELSGI